MESKEFRFETTVSKCPTCGGDAVDRGDFIEAMPENGHELETQMSHVKRSIIRHHIRKDKGRPLDDTETLKAIGDAVGLPYEPGKWSIKYSLSRLFRQWLECKPNAPGG